MHRLIRAIREPRPPALIGFGLVVMLVVALLRAPSAPGETVPPLPTDLQAMRPPLGESLPAGMPEALSAYAAGDLARAVELLGGFEAVGLADLLRRAYLGSALARSERWEEAVLILDGVGSHTLPDPWGAEAAWARAVALEETGRAAEARSVLEPLAEAPGPLGERARGLLERLSIP